MAKGASADEIKKPLPQISCQISPRQKTPGTRQAEEKFKEIGEAYEALSDPPEKRGPLRPVWPCPLRPRFTGKSGGGGFHDPFDIFREVFSGGAEAAGVFSRIYSEEADSALPPARPAV
ncbi:MAG: hypothetical protein CM1200mP34_1790 [Verrucomicrobiales bacterium]|nr:MAG: hypothetical protein CM1200mP34_1790 [Verrucomicrobiales bacterium]